MAEEYALARGSCNILASSRSTLANAWALDDWSSVASTVFLVRDPITKASNTAVQCDVKPYFRMTEMVNGNIDGSNPRGKVWHGIAGGVYAGRLFDPALVAFILRILNPRLTR